MRAGSSPCIEWPRDGSCSAEATDAAAAVQYLQHAAAATAAQDAGHQRLATASRIGSPGGFRESVPCQPLLVLLVLLPEM